MDLHWVREIDGVLCAEAATIFGVETGGKEEMLRTLKSRDRAGTTGC